MTSAFVSLWQQSAGTDSQMKELLAEMTRQPTPDLLKPWVLRYVPPKHLRLPGYDYPSVEDTEEKDMRQLMQKTAAANVLQRKRQISRRTSRSQLMASPSVGNLLEVDHLTV